MGDYTIKDLYSYGGFILGTSVTYLALQEAGVDGRWTRLIIAILVGILLGYVAERLYTGSKPTQAD